MLTTTKTAALLGIGKPRLYKLIDKLGVEPVEQGRSKLITPEMLEIIQNELGAQVVSNDAESIQNDAASFWIDSVSLSTTCAPSSFRIISSISAVISLLRPCSTGSSPSWSISL